MLNDINPYIWSDIEFNKLFARKPSHGLTKPSSIRGEGYKMVNMGELYQYDRITNQEMEYVPCTTRELEQFKLNIGDILFARQSLVLDGVGKCSIVLDVPEPTVFESHIIRIRLKDKIANPGYYHYFFSSYYGKKLIQSIGIQVAATGIRSSELSKLLVPYPPKLSQDKIFYILSNIDSLIETNSKKILLLEQMAQLLYREWFVEFRFPGYENCKFEDTELGETPEEWEISSLRDHIRVDKGVSYDGEGLTIDGNPMVNLKSISVDGRYVRGSDKPYSGEYKPRNVVVPGDIVLANTDMTQNGNVVGKAAIVPKIESDKEIIFSHHIFAIRIKSSTHLKRNYLLNLLNSYTFHGHAKGYAVGTTVLGLSADSVYRFLFPLPPSEVIDQFENSTRDVYRLIENLENQNISLTSIRDLLLPKLMSGEIDVRKLDIKGLEN